MAPQDSPDLEALFDSIIEERAGAARANPAGAAQENLADGGRNLFERVGRLTRQLHDTLKELGYDHALENTLHSIPDARSRLAYVASMTEQAARRVLDATDLAEPRQAALADGMATLGGRWEQLFAGQMDVKAFRRLAGDTHRFLVADGPAHVAATRAQLSEIMLAQDFQDLTGQVIRKITAMAQDLEQGLLGLLIEAMPEKAASTPPAGLLNGPVVRAEGRDDVVASQQQVDDLLSSLGF